MHSGLRRIIVNLYGRRLRKARGRAKDLEGLLDVVWTQRLGPLHIRPMQIRSEFRGLLEQVAQLRPRVVLEIGTARGGTLLPLAHVAAEDAIVISIDLPGGSFGGGYPPWREPLYRSFAGPKQRIVLVRDSSRSSLAKAIVALELQDRPVDFLWIDGDHRYEGVRADFEDYAPLVRAGGLIGLHDIQSGEPGRVGGVPSFWSELREAHQTREFVDQEPGHGFGIGLVVVDSATKTSGAILVEANDRPLGP